MFSAAVSVGSRLNCWKMNPTRSRRICVSFLSDSDESRTGFSPGLPPASHTSPDVTESSPARQCIRVDLPDPEGPMIAEKTPAGKPTLTFRRAETRASPLP